jgi:hypothetical protein
MNDQILGRRGGNDPPIMRILAAGHGLGRLPVGAYTRELGITGTLWICLGLHQDRHLVDREVCQAALQAPVAARILIDWMQASSSIPPAGTRKSPARKPRTTGTSSPTSSGGPLGGTFKDMRAAVPDQFSKYFYPDPAAITLTMDWKWYNQNAKWISDSYDKIVMGK